MVRKSSEVGKAKEGLVVSCRWLLETTDIVQGSASTDNRAAGDLSYSNGLGLSYMSYEL